MSERLFAERPFVMAKPNDPDSPRGRPLVASCGSGDYLSRAVVDRYEARL